MRSFNAYTRPEAALNRAKEFISVGKKKDALQDLHDVIKVSVTSYSEWADLIIHFVGPSSQDMDPNPREYHGEVYRAVCRNEEFQLCEGRDVPVQDPYTAG